MKNLYPFESNYLQRGEHRYHYLDQGKGAPVVMIHGNPTWSFYYRNLVSALRDKYRVIVPDHIGCGLSDKPGDDAYDYTLQSRLDDLEALLEHLQIEEKIRLIVHDWGGMIGMAYATRHRDKIDRLVVLNTSGFHLPKTKSFPWQLWLARTFIGTFLVRGLNAFSRGAVMMCCTRKRMSKEVRKGYLMPYDSWKNRIAVLRFVQDIPLKKNDKTYELVSEVDGNLTTLSNKPMLICWGDKDFVFDHHFFAEWQKRFPHAEIHRFSDAGHYILEDAEEEVIPLVKEFLERKS